MNSLKVNAVASACSVGMAMSSYVYVGWLMTCMHGIDCCTVNGAIISIGTPQNVVNDFF